MQEGNPVPPRGSRSPDAVVAGDEVAAAGDAVAPEDAAALRDAAEILALAESDELAAGRAREAYRTRPMARLEPDPSIARLLAPGEHLHAVRRSALLERRESATATGASAGLGGTVYLTSKRLVLVGRRTVAFALEDIVEAMLSGDQLLLVMRDGRGAALRVVQPRLFRVEVAAARAAARP